MIRRALLILFLFWISGIGIMQGQAQAGLDVQSDLAELDLPNQIAFILRATSPEKVSEVYLEYSTNGRSCVQGIARQEADLATGSPFKASWEWDFKDSGSLPVGAEVRWLWEVRTETGKVYKTQQKSLVIEDDALTWKQIENEQVVVVWSDGSDSFAQRILKVATDSLARLANEAGIAPERQVRLTVYPSFDILREAILFAPEWTGGMAFPEYGVVMLGIPVDLGEWMDSVVPHELAHLVTGERILNCLGVSMPTWLSEGLSMYAESASNTNEADLVMKNLENGVLPPLRNLAGGFSANAAETDLSYAQSGEVVRFLIREYGAEKISALLAAIQSGQRINPALQQAYGFDTDGLDNTWRSSLGFETLGSGDTPTPTPKRTSVPTLALWTSAVQASSTPSPLPEATHTPVVVAAAASDTPEAAATAVQAEAEITATSAPDVKAGGLPCVGGVAFTGGIFALIAVLPAVRRKR